jgi:hypothetical protein
MCNLPSSLHDLFANGETEYRITTDDALDNIQSMRLFLDMIGATDDDIESDDGTQVTLKLDDQRLVVDAGGDGDSFSHRFVISKL